MAALQPLINKRFQMSLETRVSISEAELLVKSAFFKNGVKEDIAHQFQLLWLPLRLKGKLAMGFRE